MLFTLDGLQVSNGEDTLLNHAEGQQLVTLYRLVHRLHHTEPRQDTAAQDFSTPRVPFPVFLHSGEDSHSTSVAAAGVTPVNSPARSRGDSEEEAHSSMVQDGAEVLKNMNRSANGMEEVHLRPQLCSASAVRQTRGRGGVEPTQGTSPILQVSTSQRNLLCAQQVVSDTNVLFFCSAAASVEESGA